MPKRRRSSPLYSCGLWSCGFLRPGRHVRRPPTISLAGSAFESGGAPGRRPDDARNERRFTLSTVKDHHGSQNVLVLAATIFLASIQIATSAQYDITDLGTLGGFSSIGLGINNVGHVVGVSGTGSEDHAFYYDGEMHDLGTLGGAKSEAYDVNDDGLVVGLSFTNDGYRAFTYDGTMHALGTLGGVGSQAYGVNASGQIAGSSLLPGDDKVRAFFYDGAMKNLGTLGADHSEGWGINDAGWIVGMSYPAIGGSRAFLYDGETMHNLGTLGGDSSFATAVSNSGYVVGYAAVSEENYHAFLYDGDIMHDLGTLGGPNSDAYGINDVGDVVGVSHYLPGEYQRHAFIYTATAGMRDLNSLVDPTSGWSLTLANAINNVGQITGYGVIKGATHAFLLTPIPPSADFNGDGVVDLFDFNILKTNFNLEGASREEGDANGDGTIDLEDFNFLKSTFGASVSVPEPTSLGLMTASALLLLVGGRGMARSARVVGVGSM